MSDNDPNKKEPAWPTRPSLDKRPLAQAQRKTGSPLTYRGTPESPQCMMLRFVRRSACYGFLSLVRKRLNVTGVTPKKDAIKLWGKMSS